MRHISGSSSSESNRECDEHQMMNVNDNSMSSNVHVATKSQPPTCKPKSRSVQRMTKRPPSERRFKCDQCDRMFFTRKDVKRHMVVHTGIRNFACPFCTQRFGRKDHLVRHAKKSHNKDTRSSSKCHSSNSSSQTGKAASATLILPRNGQHNNNSTNNAVNNSSSNKLTAQTSVCFSNGESLSVVNQNHNNNFTLISNGCENKQVPNDRTQPTHYSNHTNHTLPVSLGCLTPSPTDSFYIGIHNNNNSQPMVSGNLANNNGFKTEVTAMSGHYLAFPVSSAVNSYHSAASFLPGCFMSNSNGVTMSAVSPVPSVPTFGVPVGIPDRKSVV